MNDVSPKNRPFVRYLGWMCIVFAIVALDQASKWAVVEWIRLYDRIPINEFMNLTHQRNTGAAFSFLANAGGWQRWFFVVLSTIVSAVIAVWLWRIRNAGQTVLAIGLALVLGGAIGNLIDRVRLGYVTDFVQVYLGDKIGYFPSFNVADAAISVGAVFLIVDALFFSDKKE